VGQIEFKFKMFINQQQQQEPLSKDLEQRMHSILDEQINQLQSMKTQPA